MALDQGARAEESGGEGGIRAFGVEETTDSEWVDVRE